MSLKTFMTEFLLWNTRDNISTVFIHTMKVFLVQNNTEPPHKTVFFRIFYIYIYIERERERERAISVYLHTLKLPSAGGLMTYRRKCFILVQELSLVWVTFGVFGQPCWCPRALFHINASEMLQYSWILSLPVSLAFRCLRTHIHGRLWRICA